MLFPFLSVHWKGAAGEHQLVCASHNEPTVTVFVETGWLAGWRCTCDGVTSAGDCVGYVRKHCISVVQLGAPWCTVYLEAAVQDYKCTPVVLFLRMTFYLDGKAPEAALTLH